MHSARVMGIARAGVASSLNALRIMIAMREISPMLLASSSKDAKEQKTVLEVLAASVGNA